MTYDLDRKAAKISALSSKNLDKYEHLTGEDFSIKRSTIEQAKFEYSLLVKIFNKELDKDDKKEGLFKRLKILKMLKRNQIIVMIIVSILHLNHELIVNMMKMKMKMKMKN